MRVFKLVTYTLLYLITVAIVISSIILKPHPIDSPAITVIRSIIVFFASVLLTKYFVYMFLAPWFNLTASRENEPASRFMKEYQPLVSVMVPAWNEEVGLLSTIKTLLENTYRNMEIIVINDGSTDGSDAIMRNFIKKYEREMWGLPGYRRIIYSYQKNGGKGSALNTAVKLSHGEILISIDADCMVDSLAVASFVKAFRDPRVMAAVGNVRVGNTRTLIGVIQMLEYIFGFYMKKCDSLLNTIYIIGGAAGAFRREVFQRFKYSETNVTEDICLSMDIQDAGWRIVYCSDAIILTEGASTLAGLQKQRTRWSRGRLQCFIEKKHMFFSLRHHHNKFLTLLVLPLAVFAGVQLMVEPLFVATLFLFSCLSGDFSGFISSVIIVFLMFGIQAWDSHKWRSLLLSGIGWLLFYLLTYVELCALLKAIWVTVRKQELRWQKWARTGTTDD